MKINSIVIIIFLSCWVSFCLGQSSNEYDSKASSCQSELNVLQNKRSAIDMEYDKVVDELRQGLFCSLCNRSKSQIEKNGTNFYQHIKDVKGNVVQAPPKAYEQAHQDYLSKFNSWQQEVQNKQKSCDNLLTLSKNAAANEQRQIAQQNQQRQQQAQDQYRQQIEQNKQQQEKATQEFNQALQEKQAQLAATQQQQFGQTVSDYVNSHSTDYKERQQAADNIARQGSILAQSIQGNNVNVAKVTPSNISGSSIFSNIPTYEEIAKSSSSNSNNFFEQYSGSTLDILKDASISESQLPEVFKVGYEKVNAYLNKFNATKDLLNGKVTETVSDAYLSLNSFANPVITTIQKYSSGVAVRQANNVMDLTDKMFEQDFSEKELERTLQSMNPLHFSPSIVKEQKPFNFKDAAVVVGGGVILSAIGAPIWIGIGAAAWYGFNR